MRFCNCVGITTLLAILTLAAGSPAAAPAQQPAASAAPTVTTDVVPRDRTTGQFVADLTRDDFELYEDGVRQELTSLEVVRAVTPGIFVIVVDDLHISFQQTPQMRTLLKDVLRSVIRDGDMFGIVSTGTSSISQPLTSERSILEALADRVSGGGLKTEQIIGAANGTTAASELRQRAHVAFATAYGLVNNLEKIANRRKAVLYISSGYHFPPAPVPDDANPFLIRDASRLTDVDLTREEVELTYAANRAKATFYPIDPRGLANTFNVATIDPQIYQRNVDTLRLLADRTAGFLILNQNDWAAATPRINADTREYYVLGYSSSDPDPRRRIRQLDIRATRRSVDVTHRLSYSR